MASFANDRTARLVAYRGASGLFPPCVSAYATSFPASPISSNWRQFRRIWCCCGAQLGYGVVVFLTGQGQTSSVCLHFNSPIGRQNAQLRSFQRAPIGAAGSIVRCLAITRLPPAQPWPVVGMNIVPAPFYTCLASACSIGQDHVFRCTSAFRAQHRQRHTSCCFLRWRAPISCASVWMLNAFTLHRTSSNSCAATIQRERSPVRQLAWMYGQTNRFGFATHPAAVIAHHQSCRPCRTQRCSTVCGRSLNRLPLFLGLATSRHFCPTPGATCAGSSRTPPQAAPW